MSKKIEVLTISDPLTLKKQLEEMVNKGWKIRGFVSCNPNQLNSGPLAILEQSTDEEHSDELPCIDYSPYPDNQK